MLRLLLYLAWREPYVALRTLVVGGVVVLVLLLVGCGGPPALQRAEIPAQPSSVQPPSVTDSAYLRRLPPVPAHGVPTAPVRVQTFTEPLDADALIVQRVTVDYRPDVSCTSGFRVDIVHRVQRQQTRLASWCGPVYGEVLHITADEDAPRVQRDGTRTERAPDTASSPRADTVYLWHPTFRTGAEAEVDGSPRPQQTEVRADVDLSEDSFWAWSNLPEIIGWGVLTGGLLIATWVLRDHLLRLARAVVGL